MCAIWRDQDGYGSKESCKIVSTVETRKRTTTVMMGERADEDSVS